MQGSYNVRIRVMQYFCSCFILYSDAYVKILCIYSVKVICIQARVEQSDSGASWGSREKARSLEGGEQSEGGKRGKMQEQVEARDIGVTLSGREGVSEEEGRGREGGRNGTSGSGRGNDSRVSRQGRREREREGLREGGREETRRKQ